MTTTAALILDATPLHLRPTHDLQRMWVSSRSRWTDVEWFFDNTTPGQSKGESTLRWDIALPDGSRLSDPQWADLLDALRRLIWSLFVDPRAGKAYKPGTLGGLAVDLRPLVKWMVGRGFERLDQLSPEVCDAYIRDTVEELARTVDQDASEKVSFNTLQRRLRLLQQFYAQGAVLAEIGLRGIPEHPLRRRTASEVAREYAPRVIGWIPPIPDEVALPVMNVAWRLLGAPAEDVIALQAACLDAYENRKLGRGRGQGARSANMARARRVAKAFRFATVGGEKTPWREPITHTVVETVDQEASQHEPLQIVRNLIYDVRDAAVITLQSQVGLRVNELCGIDGAWNDQTKLPACVEVRASKTGLNDIFYLKGWLAKTRVAQEPVEWVMGLRPRGSNYIPPAVHAVMVLERLYRPWRERAGSDKLIVGFRQPRGTPREVSSLGPITTARLLKGLKGFVLKYVDLTLLPDRNRQGEDLTAYRDSRGKCLKTHQWRKTWALYVYRTDSRMIPAIAQQFHHVSLAMTEQGYLGTDPHILGALDSVQMQITGRFFYEAATGKQPLAGNMAKLVDEHRAELQAMVVEGDEQASRESIATWVTTHDLRIWFSEWGKCLIGLDPTSAKCHEIAGTTHWSRRQPNFETREPSVCAGCPCFAIDREHAEFWRRRYIENHGVLALARQHKRAHEYTIARTRATQAAAVLKMVGVAVPKVRHAEKT